MNSNRAKEINVYHELKSRMTKNDSESHNEKINKIRTTRKSSPVFSILFAVVVAAIFIAAALPNKNIKIHEREIISLTQQF